MKKKIFLFAMLFLAFSNMLWSAEVDTVWTSDYNNSIQFQHPVTKNLIFEEFDKLIEYDSKDGKFLRELPFKTDWGKNPYISPDGTKLLHTNGNHTYIYAYPSMQLIYQLDSCLYGRIISNDEVIGRNFFNSNLIKYNIKTKEKFVFEPEGSVKSIVTSPDGRFIAYSTNPIDNKNKPSKLILMDAKTFKEINVIDEVAYKEHDFGFFNFSQDGKYIAFNGKVIDGQQDLKIFSIENSKVVKNYNPFNLNADYLYLNFLNSNLYSLKIDDNEAQQSTTQVKDINTDKTILEVNNSIGFIFNKELSHLYYTDVKNKKVYCLNISKLITGITLPQSNTVVKYQNKQLTINKENVRKIEISDISGRIILNKIIENPFSNNVVLPVNLLNGSYLISIITDKETFTHKLLVVE